MSRFAPIPRLFIMAALVAAMPVFASSDKEVNVAKASAEVKNDSFRDPFWPVGYVPIAKRPPPPQPKVEKKTPVAAPKSGPVAKAPVVRTQPKPQPAPDWKKALARLRISGYAESDTGLKSCVIDDKTVSEGEVVSVEYGKFKYSWRVEQIAPVKSQMRFTRQGAVLLKK